MFSVLEKTMLGSSVFVSPTTKNSKCTCDPIKSTRCNFNSNGNTKRAQDKDQTESEPNISPFNLNSETTDFTPEGDQSVKCFYLYYNRSTHWDPSIPIEPTSSTVTSCNSHHHRKQPRPLTPVDSFRFPSFLVSTLNGKLNFYSNHRKLSHLNWTSSFIFYCILFIALVISFSNCHVESSSLGSKVYTDQFVAHIEGPPEMARSIAEKHGFTYLDHIIDNAYHLKHNRLTKRSLSRRDWANATSTVDAISLEPLVSQVNQLKRLSRTKRDLIRLHSYERPLGSLATGRRTSSRLNFFDDPKWTQMWYLNRGQGLDMNVQKVWAMNITGRGVVVTILDDGLENDHPDLITNYDPAASYDVNNSDNDPSPRYDIIDSNRHGTRCAGEVAAMANNSNCAVGVAFNARVGGLRMLDGDVTDAVEARSLSFNRDHIDIYSASWGPDDDGKTVDGPGELATKAFIDGVRKGRRGLGSIFIWASGNGGREHDNCNCDGYTNSIWTLSISSATENGLVPWYSEACSSTLATTYSSGSIGEKQIVTTDLHHGCTISHTGTSASAPLAAAIAALALEANPNLTWRDMQHIVAMTARPANLRAPDWKTNGVGRKVSHSFGYGLMDAAAMVELAKVWVTVPEQKTCEISSNLSDKLIPSKSYIDMSLTVNCNHALFLEHVQARINLSSTRRGDIHIYLTSPAGTRSTLLEQRPMDNSHSGFQDWPFMTVHTWGENPNGVWRLEVHNDGKYPYNRAFLKGWSMVLFGTSINPDRRRTKSTDEISKENKFPSNQTSLVKPTEPIATQLNLSANGTQKAVNPPLITNELESESSHAENSVSNLRDDSRGTFISHRTRGNDFPKITKPFSPEKTDSNSGCRVSDNSRCLECEPNYILHQSNCVTFCPNGFYKETTAKESFICAECYYNCYTCTGPNVFDCSSCHGDSLLRGKGNCEPKDLRLQLDELKRYYSMVTTMIVFLFVVTFIFAILIIHERCPNLLKCCRWPVKRGPTRFYDGFVPQTEPRSSSNFLRLKSIGNLNFYSQVSDDENAR